MPQTQTVNTASQAVDTPTDREEMAACLFAAFNRRDLDGMLELLDPDVLFLPTSAAVMSEGEPYRGHEGMRRYSSDVAKHWAALTVHPVQIRAAGEAVVALGRVSGQGPEGTLDGVPTTWVIKFRDNLVVHIQIFSDERPLLEAFGLDA